MRVTLERAGLRPCGVRRLGNGSKLLAFEQRIGEPTLAYLAINGTLMRPGASLDTAAWTLVRMVEPLCVRYVLDMPPIPRDQFLDETSAMALNYLRPSTISPEDCCA